MISNGQYLLIMQGDGNLVEYSRAGQVIGDTGTQGNPGAYAYMQGDGNLVIYSSSGHALWDSHTEGESGQYISLGDDGRLMWVDSHVWVYGGSYLVL